MAILYKNYEDPFPPPVPPAVLARRRSTGFRVGYEHEVMKVRERVREPLVGQFVAQPTTFGGRDHQSATSEARQVIRHRLPREVELLREVGRVRGRLQEGHQDASPCFVGQRVTESRECTQ